MSLDTSTAVLPRLADAPTLRTPPDDGSPDLTHYLAVHDRMRSDTRRFALAVQTAVELDREGRLRPLARWATGFAHELHLHHTVEDRVLFPGLVAVVPAAEQLLSVLERDHVAVAGMLARWPGCAKRLADRTRPFRPARDEMLDLSIGLRDLLQAHLDVEDTEILPLFAEHFTEASWTALNAQALKVLPKHGLAFSVPWNVAAMPPAEGAAMLAEAPLPLRALHRLTRGRFDRLVAAAFSGVPTNVAADV